jgi:hypothetical protein
MAVVALLAATEREKDRFTCGATGGNFAVVR